MQRPAPLVARYFLLSPSRLLERLLGGHGDEGVQGWIQLFDAVEAIACQFERRDLLAPDLRGHIHQRFHVLHGSRAYCILQ